MADLTQEAFDTLLSRLNNDPEKAAEIYLDLYRKLIQISRFRGVDEDIAAELADETLARVANSLMKNKEIPSINAFAFGVAQNVWREYLRQANTTEQVSTNIELVSNYLEDEYKERFIELEKFLSGMNEQDREFILDFYSTQEPDLIKNVKKNLTETYIQKAQFKNIRSIIDFEIEFKNPAGWHVLIGDNGSGKSTLIRSMALALVGEERSGLRINWEEWLNKQSKKGEIKLTIANKEKKYPLFLFIGASEITFASNSTSDNEVIDILPKSLLKRLNLFSVAFGPYRRFQGGSSKWDEIYKNPSFAKLASHLSAFGEEVALTETTSWLEDLNYKSLEKDRESSQILDNLKKLINSDDFLPHNTKLERISSQGVFFKDGNGSTVLVNQMSDGYRSILSLTFELIRQLVRVYGSKKVFKNIEKGKMFIDLPGVVLVDEIDAHLHPTWQTRIGQWFLNYFPRLQFIVTTHSPLVCRAAANGSIWRLAAPGSNEKSGEVAGIDRDRLIYGNILDAYGTEVFGEDVSISADSVEKQEELVKLSKKKMLDTISTEEEEKLDNLRKVFTTDASIEL